MKFHYLVKILLIIILCVSILTGYSGSGSGTEGDPYLITTLSQLQEMKDDLTANYRLSNDIDASGTATWNDNGEGGYYGFEPIGTQSTPFKGGFDGDYHVISDLYINRPLLDDVGLFGYSDWESNYIKNVGLENVDFTGGYRSGGLIGRSDTPISNCFVRGSVAGAKSTSVVAGLAAQSHDPVTRCYADVDVTTNSEVAGFISFNNDDVTNCYAVGSVQSKTKDGGFIGNPFGHGDGNIYNCFWDTETSGQEDKKADHVIISAICYNPDVLDDEYQFIMLYNPTSSAVDLDNWDYNDGNGYTNIGSTTNIPANGFFLIGVTGITPSADLTASLNMNTSSGTISIRDGSDTEIDAVTYTTDAYPVYKRYAIYGGGSVYSNDYEPSNTSQVNEFDMTGKTTVQMKTSSTFTDAGWDFVGESANGNDDNWTINALYNDGYPYLNDNPPSEVPLPICLASFSAEVKNGAVELSWETASETNNARFLLYRNDEVIESIEGAGTTSEPHSYEYIDHTVVPGVSYTYVLADVDYANDEVKHSDLTLTLIVSENDIPQEFTLENNYPNPFNPSTAISYHLKENCDLELSIYDMDGKIVETLVNDNISAGNHTVNWDASGLSSGVYLYRLKTDNFIETKKMVLMK